MLAGYPKASRPITALQRRGAGIVPSFAVLAAAGVGAVSAAMTAKVSASAAMAGVGSSLPQIIGQASASMATAGAGATGFVIFAGANATFTAAGVGALNAPNSIVSAYMGLSTAGSGAFSGTLTARASATMSAAGSGAFAPVILSQASGTLTIQGMGGMGSSDNPASAASFDGLGILSAVGYAFYADAEKAAPKEEVRVVYVPYVDRHPVAATATVASEPRTTSAPSENRVAVVPYENRVYEVSSKPRFVGPPNRRRTL